MPKADPPPIRRGVMIEVPIPEPPEPKPRPPAKWRAQRPTRGQVRKAIKFLAPALLALVVVLGTAAAGSGDRDYALTIPGEHPICSKSEESCNAARDAIGSGKWTPLGMDRRELDAKFQAIDCVPHPSCFPEASNVIRGFNDR